MTPAFQGYIRGKHLPDSKVHGVNMGPIWGRQDPGGPHVGPMSLAIWANIDNQSFHSTVLAKQHTNTLYRDLLIWYFSLTHWPQWEAALILLEIFKFISKIHILSISWNCPQVKATRHQRWSVNTGQSNGLVLPGNNPLDEPILTQIYNTICRHSRHPIFPKSGPWTKHNQCSAYIYHKMFIMEHVT